MGWLPVPFLIPDPPHRQNRPGICQQVYKECGREPNTLPNRQYLTRDILVDSADREAPRLVSSQQENDRLYPRYGRQPAPADHFFRAETADSCIYFCSFSAGFSTAHTRRTSPTTRNLTSDPANVIP